MIFFLLLNENICCGYSLEVPHRGTSNEYLQHMFLLRNKKDISIFWMKKVPYLLLWVCCGNQTKKLLLATVHPRFVEQRQVPLILGGRVLVKLRFQLSR